MHGACLDLESAFLAHYSQGPCQRVSLDPVKEETTVSKAEIPRRHISLGDLSGLLRIQSGFCFANLSFSQSVIKHCMDYATGKVDINNHVRSHGAASDVCGLPSRFSGFLPPS